MKPKIDLESRYNVREVEEITGKNKQQIYYYIKRGFIMRDEVKTSTWRMFVLGQRISIKGTWVQRILEFYYDVRKTK